MKNTKKTKCKQCSKNLPASSFYVNKKKKNGLSSYCKGCCKMITITRRLKITLSEYERLMDITHCNLCSREFENTINKHIDHCHTSGLVRGVLCRQCNLALGHLNDDPELIRKLAKYVESNR